MVFLSYNEEFSVLLGLYDKVSWLGELQPCEYHTAKKSGEKLHFVVDIVQVVKSPSWKEFDLMQDYDSYGALDFSRLPFLDWELYLMCQYLSANQNITL